MIPLFGYGWHMVTTSHAQHTGSSSEANMEGSGATSYGRLAWKINANFLPGFYCKKII
jgi:hypothetical protein